jgi:hypothetical protein
VEENCGLSFLLREKCCPLPLDAVMQENIENPKRRHFLPLGVVECPVGILYLQLILLAT